MIPSLLHSSVRTFLSTLLLCALLPCTAEAKSRVVIVLDASGSMQAEISGTSKMDIARKALSDLLQDWNADADLGLVVYGHRSKGDCDDIELVIPIGPLDTEKVIGVANKLTPLGKTPVSAATLFAADALKYTEEKASVIVITDGEETCDQDPCELGKELESKGVDFTAHVIGFDIGDETKQAKLRCLAESTGGKFLAPKDAGELREALVAVVEEVKAEPPAPETTPAAAAPSAFTATYSEGGDRVEKDVRWEIFKHNEDPEELGDSLATAYDAKFKPEVDAGKYIVQATAGNAKGSKTVEIGPNSKGAVIVLNAGVVKPSVRPAEGADIINNDLTWIVLQGSDEDPKEIERKYDAKPVFTLSSGEYTIQVNYGEASTKAKITVEAGSRKPLDLILGAGLLHPTAVYSKDSKDEPANLTWIVSDAKEKIDGSREEIVRNYDAKPKLKLAQGTYLLQVNCGEATAKTEVEIKANEVAKPQVDLNAGVLKATPKGITKDLSWNVKEKKADINGDQKDIWSSYDDSPSITLNAGDYILTLKHKDSKAEKEFTIKAGERTSIELELTGE